LLAALAPDLLPNEASRCQDNRVHSNAIEGCREADDLRYLLRAVDRRASRKQPAKTVTDESELGARFLIGLIHCIEEALKKEVRTLGVSTDSRVVRPVPDAAEPTVHFHEVLI
jgi:hypothetical protein